MDGVQHVVVLGEVLWDVFDHSRYLGGAALNFAAHARRMGHKVSLISAVGADALGQEAMELIARMDLETAHLQTTGRFPTGTAQVRLAPEGGTLFSIERPAAYDAISISDLEIERIVRQRPTWFYFGTLFASSAEGSTVLDRLLLGLCDSTKFYDLNLRPGFDSPVLVSRLLERADVVKLNEEELHQVREFTGLPQAVEDFCRDGARRFGWKAVGVTLGAHGCALLANGQYVEAAGHPIQVVDTVGAGDAFAAAFMHGLSSHWPAPTIAAFANRVGALVASRHGAIPDWTPEEAVQL